MSKVYRHKFTPETIEKISYFAKLHMHDDRHVFKDAWERWIEVNNETITSEIQLHTDAGYTGDVVDKMYKSARYYFRKKKPEVENKDKDRREYVALDRELLQLMDQHINENIDNKPSNAFDDFCKANIDSLKTEVRRLKDYLEGEEIGTKIKKTYKNRHFNAQQAKTAKE